MTQTKEMRAAARLMKAVTALFGVMSAKELIALAGELEKRAAVAKVGEAKPTVAEPQAEREEVVEAALVALTRSQSRSEGHKVLEDLKPTRSELAGMARHLNVYVTKEDNASRLVEKIIGAAIGSRLSSIAIRGESFDAAPPKD